MLKPTKRVTNFIENQKATAHDSKDWGISLLIGTGENRMDAGQSCGLVTSSRTTKAGNEFSLNVDSTKKSEFFAFLDKVLRVQMPEKLINESMEDMEISPKKSKMSEEMSSDSFDSGHESIGECFNCSVEFKLWEGRRGTRRQLEREYKNAKPIDIESQVSAILLGKTPKKLGEAMAFRLQVADAGIRLLPEKKSQEFSELFRFLEQAVTKYFLAEA